MEKEMLVSYSNLPYGLRKKGLFDIIPISEARFRELKASGLSHISYENRFVPKIYLEITKRCNLNCMHCFASAGSSCTEELTLQEIDKITDDAASAGVLGFVLTGGEPLLHPDFLDIVKMIHEKHMGILEINTNGVLLNPETLIKLKEIGEIPSIKISLDGIGIHDTFRNCEGAEAAAKKALELSVRSGFRTYAQIQINKLTLPYICGTLEYLDSIGVSQARLIRTARSKRWAENGLNYDLTFEEYYDECLDITGFYLSKARKTLLDFWGFISINPQAEKQILMPYFVKSENDTKRPICSHAAKTLAVDANGEIYPCLEISSVINEPHDSFGNVKEKRIGDILKNTDSDICKFMSHTIDERKTFNKAVCGNCEYSDICAGGCPGLSLIGKDKNLLGIDESVCTFFKDGYYKKILNKQREKHSLQ